MNNIPWKLPTSVEKENQDIATAKRKLRIKGASFDLATSVDGLNNEQDLTLFNKDGVHPNEKGLEKMFERFKMDVSEVFK